jgi:hypothetical protein
MLSFYNVQVSNLVAVVFLPVVKFWSTQIGENNSSRKIIVEIC